MRQEGKANTLRLCYHQYGGKDNRTEQGAILRTSTSGGAGAMEGQEQKFPGWRAFRRRVKKGGAPGR
jgi:hypothetical protein